MSKAVMISIKPKWCKLIASGEKTIEVRKTRPKLETPFKCYIFCTQDGKENFICRGGEDLPFVEGNGAIIGEFVCYQVTIHFPGYKNGVHGYWDILNKHLVDIAELNKYGKWKPLFAWRISDLKIYDTPKELSEFIKPCEHDFSENCFDCKNLSFNDVGKECCDRRLTRPPQSWCYVEVQNGNGDSRRLEGQ